MTDRSGPGQQPGQVPNAEALWARSVMGARSLMRLMRHDPDELTDTAEQFAAALVMIGRRPFPPGTIPATLLAAPDPDGSAPAAPDAGPGEHQDEQGESGTGLVVVGPVTFTALCQQHLLPWAGISWVAYDPGPPEHPDHGRPVRPAQLSDLVRFFASGLTSPHLVSSHTAAALHRELGGQAGGCLTDWVHRCPVMHDLDHASSATWGIEGMFPGAGPAPEPGAHGVPVPGWWPRSGPGSGSPDGRPTGPN